MLEKQRQKIILEILAENQFASIRKLCLHLDTSEATIRRDITKMAKSKLIKKIRGGAEASPISFQPNITNYHSLIGSSFLEDKGKRAYIKRLIAKKAVDLCHDGESIIINGGSSTYMMREFLIKRELSILTNSFVLAQELLTSGNNQVTLPGGEVYREQGIILSSFENDTIQYYRGSKMFMGTPGIGEFGVMESDPLLIRAEQKLQKQADKLVILADSSKLGQRSNFIVSPLEEVDILITDSLADSKLLKEFESHGIEVIIADIER